MKKLRSIVLLVSAVSLLLFNACNKTTIINSKDNGVGTEAGEITFKADGVTKKSNLSFTTLYTSSNTIQIQGQIGAEIIGISIDGVKIGTFDVATSNNMTVTYGTESTYNKSFLGITGTVVVTSLTSTSITGTFYFTGLSNADITKQVVISEGKFNVNYITI